MRLRKQKLGDKNIIGARVEMKRKELGIKQKDFLAQLQVAGMDINASGLSKLEGQIRSVYDYELAVISRVLGVSISWLLGEE
ncbi:MAG: XRE family transcriptional regulator [Clostridia bacterium]|nr:XRE family transcriptional regulator [Clostridia bacterium]